MSHFPSQFLQHASLFFFFWRDIRCNVSGGWLANLPLRMPVATAHPTPEPCPQPNGGDRGIFLLTNWPLYPQSPFIFWTNEWQRMCIVLDWEVVLKGHPIFLQFWRFGWNVISAKKRGTNICTSRKLIRSVLCHPGSPGGQIKRDKYTRCSFLMVFPKKYKARKS